MTATPCCCAVHLFDDLGTFFATLLGLLHFLGILALSGLLGLLLFSVSLFLGAADQSVTHTGVRRCRFDPKCGLGLQSIRCVRRVQLVQGRAEQSSQAAPGRVWLPSSSKLTPLLLYNCGALQRPLVCEVLPICAELQVAASIGKRLGQLCRSLILLQNTYRNYNFYNGPRRQNSPSVEHARKFPYHYMPLP